ncbi:hypothetical protein FQR65_LT16598 [Abscondita terminalis]|nr:hypothetical protein FQR65_LT16598 [Abscondita terminalis]
MYSDDSIDDPNYSPSSEAESKSEDNIQIKQPYVKLKRLKIDNFHSIRKSPNKTKNSFCLYCTKTVTKLPRHLELMHGKEERVMEFLSWPKFSSERKVIITNIRNEGNFIFNTKIQNNGDILCSRRRRNNDTEYLPCGSCKGFFSKNSLRRHFNRCVGEKKTENCMVASKRIFGKIHHKASEVLKEKVFPILREDEITNTIRFDELIILYGNKMCQKYRSGHHHNMIRARMRLLGRMMLAIKSECKYAVFLSDVLSPKMYDIVIKSVNTVAGLDKNSLNYKTPTNATNLGTLLKSCCRILIAESIKQQNVDLQKRIEDFLKLLEEDYGTAINSAAIENLAELKRQKSITLPTTGDIKLLSNYLQAERSQLYRKLQNNFDFHVWKECASVVLTEIQVFNRRRAGELERLKISDFNRYQTVDDEEDVDIISNLPVEERKNAHKYVRIQLRGKLGRSVSILIDKNEFKTLQLVISKREEAGVPATNPYVFGLPGGDGINRHLSACRLLQKYSEECGAIRPENLRGTQLRKHMATHSANYNLNDSEFQDLTNFMGHADKIHKEHYRIPVATREITRISTILQKARGSETFVQEEHEKDTNKLSESLVQEHENESNKLSEKTFTSNETKETELALANTKNVLNRKTRSVSPKGHIQRRSWTTTEINVMQKEFEHYISSKTLPSIQYCSRIKNKYEVLQQRSPVQMKTWIDNQARKENRKEERKQILKSKITRTKWTSPEKQIMLKVFHSHLNNEYLPTRMECVRAKETESVLENRSVEVIKAWVNNQIKKNKKN